MTIAQDRRSSQAEASPSKTVPASETVAPPHWLKRYTAIAALCDIVVIAAALGFALLVSIKAPGRGISAEVGQSQLSYWGLALLIGVVWFAALTLGRTRHRRVLGAGPMEYQRVAGVTWQVFALVALTSYLLKLEVGRGFVAVALPLGLGLLLLGRYLMRRRLHKARAAGRWKFNVVVVGTPGRAAELIWQLNADSHAGLKVVGVCLESPTVSEVAGVPVVGSFDDVRNAASDLDAPIVIAIGGDTLTASAIRNLSWDLEGTGIDLTVAPALVDIAGPRVITSPVAGTTLLHLDAPEFTGGKYVAKSVFDWVVALFITILISPALLAIAVLVRATSRGPVFYTQERIGLNSKPFKMLKFRSMRAGAHEDLATVLAAEGIESVGLFYKPKNDPRVTPVGRVLRRYSLDELPQLLNVLKGEMSLVGPRPQITDEVALYDQVARRRLKVKPGLTGLWQVSGRSELSPAEGIRMDVYYVENWTIFGDLLILFRTLRVVLMGDGAY